MTDEGQLYTVDNGSNGNLGGNPITSGAGQATNKPNNGGTGEIIRINPLQNGGNSYSIPSSNPFVGQASVAEEIYALGFRDAQTFSFGTDNSG